jgi:hypothetical protein
MTSVQGVSDAASDRADLPISAGGQHPRRVRSDRNDVQSLPAPAPNVASRRIHAISTWPSLTGYALGADPEIT